MHKYRLVYLPSEATPLIANLDELSLQGWEFVAWHTDFLNSTPPSRMALIRRAEPQSGDANG